MQGAPPGQGVPHDPQLRLFVSRSTQAPPHSVSPAAVLHVPVQLPAAHSVFGGHRARHAPQLAGSVCVSVQVIPQSVSAPQEQAPLTQSAPAGHGELHAPQLFASFERSTQAPPQSVSAPLESVSHEVAQVPAAQTLSAPPSVAQTWPHDPQLLGSLSVAVHTPLHRCPPFAHWHVPFWQLVPPVQRTLHPPQLALSTNSLTHEVPQRSPVAQAHSPFWHCSALVHASPQPPQFAGSVTSLTHAPLQSVRSVAHVEEQTLFEQTWPDGQGFVHAPQFCGSEVVSTQAPPQSVSPVAHVEVQTPFEHTWSERQAMPHPPQFSGSDAVGAHSPPHASVPAGHTSPSGRIRPASEEVMASMPVSIGGGTAPSPGGGADPSISVVPSMEKKPPSPTKLLSGFGLVELPSFPSAFDRGRSSALRPHAATAARRRGPRQNGKKRVGRYFFKLMTHASPLLPCVPTLKNDHA